MTLTQSARDARFWFGQNLTTVISGVAFVALTCLWYGTYFNRIGNFPDSFDYTTLVNTALPLIVVAIGQTIVVVVRGLDLSVGGVISLSNVIAAQYMHDAGSLVWAVPLVVLVGMVAGAINGYLISYLRLTPILVTLGTLSVFNGFALMIMPSPGGFVTPELSAVLSNSAMPIGAVFIALILVGWFVMRRIRFGVWLFAVGNDENAARARGVPVRRTKFTAYVLSGTLAAIAGLFFTARTTAGDPLSGQTFVLMSIAAVFLGGASMFGGRATAIGTVMGALSLTLITSVLFFANVNPLYQAFFEGALLIVAVGVGLLAALWTTRRRERKTP